MADASAAQNQPTNPNQPGGGGGKNQKFSSIVVNSVLNVPKKKSFITFLILLIIGIMIYYAWNYMSSNIGFLGPLALRFVLSIGAYLVFIYVILRGWSDKDESSKWVATAIFIWFLDMVNADSPFVGWIANFLGPPYAGFEFHLVEALSTNWIAVLTSAGFIAFIWFKFWDDAVNGNALTLPIYFAILIFVVKIGGAYLQSYRFVYNYLSIPITYFNYIIGALILVFLFLAFTSRKNHPELYSLPTYVFMALVFSFFSVNNGWISNKRAILHLLFIFAFGFGYIRRQERENPSAWHMWTSLLLIADFYLYNIFWLGSNEWGILQFIPVLVAGVIVYCYNRSETGYTRFVGLAILAIIWLSFLPTSAIDSGSIQFTAKKGTTFKDFAASFTDKIKDIWEGRLDIATGGLYRGDVEKNRFESLGVYFSNIRAADPRFYTDEAITVWGTIRSKTYKDAVIVQFNCTRLKKDKRIKADKIIPEVNFPVFTLDNVDTECTFIPKSGADKIDPGPNTVVLSAEYNFGTDAYLKTYFIDRERFKASSREDIDVLSQFGITDKNPVAIYTNGPVEVGIQAGPLVTVSNNYPIKPTIGISLLNRESIQDQNDKVISKWEGRIKKITEIVLLAPPGITLPNIEACKDKNPLEVSECPCSVRVNEYTENHCKTSCDSYVNKPCLEVCRITYGNDNTGKSQCEEGCKDSVAKCNDECASMFCADDNGDSAACDKKYKGYSLDVNSIEFRDLNKDIDKHRSFLCRFDPTPAVLDDTPITTRYFRLRTRYDYVLENPVTITVEQSPIESKTLVPEQLLKSAIKSASFTSDTLFSGIGTDMIAAIASVESGFRHCCAEPGKTSAKTCVREETETCPADRIINSGSSIGVMQIQYDSDKVRNEVNQLVDKYCDTKSIYNYDCNVIIGAVILRQKYDAFKDGCMETWTYKNRNDPAVRSKSGAFIDGCEKGVTSSGKHYYDYRGIEAALRGYNGWAITGGDKDYVEKVVNARNSIQGANIIDPDTLRSVFPTEETPGGNMFENFGGSP